MGVHLSPVGPLPASVYWRRRAVLLVGLLLLLLVLSQCAGSDDPEPTAESLAPSSAPPSSTTPVPSVPASTTPSVAPSVTPSATPSVTPSASPSAAPACADGDLSVTADTDEARYSVGDSPRFTLRIENTSDAPCRRGIGAGSIELQVRSGSDRIWSSDDCGGKGRAGVATLAPGDPKAATVAWNARRSRPGCSGEKERISPGTYRVVGRVGELVVEGAVFTVVP